MNNEDERRGLLKFVPPNFLPMSVLVIESAELLSDLRKILPAAQIALLTSERKTSLEKICKEFRADLLVGDYRRGELPGEPKIFEWIIARDVLKLQENLYPTLLAINHLLKDSGALLARFSEAEWTKARLVKLLDEAIYKEIHFLPEEEDWLVKACKCTAEVAALKDLFTPQVRADLSRLLHRIEYDIEAEENFSRLEELCRREEIFDEYLDDFIEQVVLHVVARDFIRERIKQWGQ